MGSVNVNMLLHIIYVLYVKVNTIEKKIIFFLYLIIIIFIFVLHDICGNYSYYVFI